MAATISEGDAHLVTASDYFSGEGVTYGAESSDTGVATVAVSGAAVTATAVKAGSATVTVTATNAGGSAEQSFVVMVLPPAPAAVGSIEAATITEGGTHEVTASDYFSGEGVTYGAESSDAGAASVAVDGAAVTVTALAVGSAAVTVTATNAAGSAEQSFAVTVLPARADGSRQHRGGDAHRGRDAPGGRLGVLRGGGRHVHGVLGQRRRLGGGGRRGGDGDGGRRR